MGKPLYWTENDLGLLEKFWVENKLPVCEIANIFWAGEATIQNLLRARGFMPTRGHQSSFKKLSKKVKNVK